MRKNFRDCWFLCVAAIALCSSSLAHAQQRLSGEVLGFDGGSLRLQADGGQVLNVRVTDSARIITRAPADIAQLARGDFLGTTAEPLPDGSLKALEVHVFSESMRGTGEGHRPMDNLPGKTMTNATVSGIAAGKQAAAGASSMTNATVAQVAGDQHGRKLTLTYKGGEQTVLVPDGTPVTRIEPGDRSLLVKGAHIALTATVQADGSLGADRVTVGRSGYVPTP